MPLDYVTDLDLHTDPQLLDGARAVISMGHDEYWSPRMRAAVTAARDAGTNLAFPGANAVYRRIRYAATPLGPDRLEINYNVAAEDPLDGNNAPDVTANWPAPPNADPGVQPDRGAVRLLPRPPTSGRRRRRPRQLAVHRCCSGTRACRASSPGSR